ncbi:precorrin-8X methylmutase [Romeria aff. gracilis LEGE 07310]|uniref:Precorrin-8X methylmutase n=1 Tax=Vasconcelosia minhoensis LEGE 07310 TaxID=915328 RepID=A0A8J7ANN2_9CYAN|nr:precorrin-8X methylmutase [Romeria gracilis]MBE9077476.1 precorrin-8X methylmutase [Romeria aff. gracilis LEGE 07310]
MPVYPEHPILRQSFAVIDQEIGEHRFSPAEYAVVRRLIHSTADFQLASQLTFSATAIAAAAAALRQGTPIITDVSMVAQGIRGVVSRTWKNPIVVAIDRAEPLRPGQTRTASGLLNCWQAYPDGIFVIANAPTALLALCEALCNQITHGKRPAFVLGAPVGFINVVESKQALAAIPVPQIRIDGRRGGSGAAAAIVNALLIWSWEQLP